MYQFRGTKGKWKVDSYDNTLVIPDIRYTNEGICRCFSRNYTGNKYEDIANAKLISKAPEMLQMLINLDREGGLGHDRHAAIEKLIKEATEL